MSALESLIRLHRWQLDERRRFTETVLSGVSAGVIGLDASGRIELPNSAADELLGIDLLSAIGSELADVVPEFAVLLHEAAASPERARTAEIQLGPATRRRTLLVRIGADLSGGRTDGFVVTFDEILNCKNEFAPDVDKLTMTSPAPLQLDKLTKHYPCPQPGIVKDREYLV